MKSMRIKDTRMNISMRMESIIIKDTRMNISRRERNNLSRIVNVFFVSYYIMTNPNINTLFLNSNFH